MYRSRKAFSMVEHCSRYEHAVASVPNKQELESLFKITEFLTIYAYTKKSLYRDLCQGFCSNHLTSKINKANSQQRNVTDHDVN